MTALQDCVNYALSKKYCKWYELYLPVFLHLRPHTCKEQLLPNYGIIQLPFLAFSHKPECILGDLENKPFFNFSTVFIVEFLPILQFNRPCVRLFWRIDAYSGLFMVPRFWMPFSTWRLMHLLFACQILFTESTSELLRTVFCMLKTAGITGWRTHLPAHIPFMISIQFSEVAGRNTLCKPHMIL